MEILNKQIEALMQQAPQGVVDAIGKAAQDSGVDFGYLLQQARAESSFDADAKAKTSSASGLFQFIESTWMTMVERYGEKYGIDANNASRDDLLSLRNDADMASSMAAEFANENQRSLKRNWGGDVGATELYFAHFLGAGQASAFLSARDADGAAPAAALFPKAAAANEGVFYDRASGRARSLDEVYAFFDKKFIESDGYEYSPQTQTADAGILSTDSPSASSTPITQELLAEMLVQDSVVAKNNFDFSQFNARKAEAEMQQRALSSYQSYLMNPLDLILLTQLDTPLG